jgi:ribonuclease P protein component
MLAPEFQLVTMQRRSEFLRVRNGLRCAMAAFVVEAKSRDGFACHASVKCADARFGFTVTKQIGSAVQRNFVRRRLKEAVKKSAAGRALAGFDYVIIARAAAEGRTFTGLVADFETAFSRVHNPQSRDRSNERVSKPKKAPHS